MFDEIIEINPEKVSGTPVFAGTRVPIENLFDYLEGGDGLEDFLEGFPPVTREQAIAVLENGSEIFDQGSLSRLKILLDHNLDRRLKRFFAAHEVFTTQEQGWADELNGALLLLAEGNGFQVLITADSNIKNQQNLKDRPIAILVLRSFNNRLSTHSEMVELADRVLDEINPGQILEVFHPSMNRDQDDG